MQTLQKVISSGWLGEIHEAEIHYDIDSPPWVMRQTDPGWAPGGGMNFGIGCHSLDQALHLFNAPSSVTAFYRNLRGIKSESEDTFTMILQYDNNPLIVTVKTNCRTRMVYPLKYLIRGYQGTFIKYGDDQQEKQVQQGMKPGDAGFGVEPEAIWGEIQTSEKVLDNQEKKGDIWVGKLKSEVSSYANYYRDVVRAVRGEIAPVIKAETSRNGLRVIELARESVQKKTTVPFTSA